MKLINLEKKELLTLIASLILIPSSILIFTFFGNRGQVKTSASTEVKTQQVTQVTDRLNKLLIALQKTPTEAGITQADDLLKKLPDSKQKKEMLAQLDAIKISMANKKAEENILSSAKEAVANLENNQSDDNLTSAQKAVDKVAASTSKNELQARIDAVKANLEALALAATLQESQVESEDTQATSYYQESNAGVSNETQYTAPATNQAEQASTAVSEAETAVTNTDNTATQNSSANTGTSSSDTANTSVNNDGNDKNSTNASSGNSQ